MPALKQRFDGKRKTALNQEKASHTKRREDPESCLQEPKSSPKIQEIKRSSKKSSLHLKKKQRVINRKLRNKNRDDRDGEDPERKNLKERPLSRNRRQAIGSL